MKTSIIHVSAIFLLAITAFGTGEGFVDSTDAVSRHCRISCGCVDSQSQKEYRFTRDHQLTGEAIKTMGENKGRICKEACEKAGLEQAVYKRNCEFDARGVYRRQPWRLKQFGKPKAGIACIW